MLIDYNYTDMVLKDEPWWVKCAFKVTLGNEMPEKCL